MSEAQEDLLQQSTHFAFGENWLDYASKIDAEKIEHAVADLQRLNGGADFKSKRFLDIGCGSGIHALAACKLGARSVAGIDIDPQSVEAARRTFAKFAPSIEAKFEVKSVFETSPEQSGTFDVVYSWGVLHHTGDMYGAIRKAAALVAPSGELQIALYKKTPFCGMWRHIKKWYRDASPDAQRRARAARTLVHKGILAARGESLDEYIAGYNANRGMDYYNDLHDWMGGYPYESISPEECESFVTPLGFRLVRSFVKPLNRLPGLLGIGCDEYVFVRVS